MFAAIFIRSARQDPREYATAESLLAHLTPFKQADLTGAWTGDRALIAQALTWNTPESKHETTPEVCSDTGRVIASWVRLDNRAELCATLKLENRQTLTDPQIILAAHRVWGAGCAQRLEGDFSFIIYEPERHKVLCVRDSIGTKPFYYILNNDYFIAASSIAVLRKVNNLRLSRSLKWTGLFLAVLNIAHTDGAYEGVKKLPPAHSLTITARADDGPNEYFRFDLDAPHATQRDSVWVDRYRDAFDRAVSARARSAYLIGAESSAGLDSSSVIAGLADVLPHARDDFHCFGMAGMQFEPELLLLTAAKCDIRHSHILMTPERMRIDSAFHRSMKALGHPPEHGQMLFHPSFFEVSQNFGIRTLASGYGGDEVATNHAQSMIEELWAKKAYSTVLHELPGIFPIRLARFAKRLWKGPHDPRVKHRLIIREQLAVSCLRQDFLQGVGLEAQIKALEIPIDAPVTLNSALGLSLFFRFARSGRLESEALFAASYKMEYRWPFLDRALLQQYFSTPAIEKRHRDMGRFLHRRSMKERVPERILWQKTKKMGSYIGGGPKVEQANLIQFIDLPEALRGILDREKYNGLRDQMARDEAADRATSNRNLVFAWQVRQATAWINGD